MLASRNSKVSLGVIIGVIILLGLGTAFYSTIQPFKGSSPSESGSIRNSTSVAPNSTLTLSGTVPLPATQGRIDHMAVDLQKGVLFVAAYGNNSVGVVDINSGQLVRSITGLNSPQGVAFAPDSAQLYVR